MNMQMWLLPTWQTHQLAKASVSQANNREHAVTYGAACGYNTCNTSLLYLWIMTAALKMSRTSPHKQDEISLP